MWQKGSYPVTMEREAAPSFTLTRQTSQLQIKIVMPKEGRVRRLGKEKSICVPMVPQSQHHGNKSWCFAFLNLNENLFICLYLFCSVCFCFQRPFYYKNEYINFWSVLRSALKMCENSEHGRASFPSAWENQHLIFIMTQNNQLGKSRIGAVQVLRSWWSLLARENIENSWVLHLTPGKGIFMC